MGYFTPQRVQGEEFDIITLYALNKATYDVISEVAETDHPVVITRENKPLVMIVPVENVNLEGHDGPWRGKVLQYG